MIRFFHKKFINEATELTVRRKGLTFFLPNLVENISFDLYFEGKYEIDLVNHLVNNIPQNGIFLDIGANIGAISIHVAFSRPDVKVFSFEASPQVFSWLQRNTELNKLENLQIFNKAIHKEDNLTLDFFAPERLFGKGSFSPVFTKVPEWVSTIKLDTFLIENNLAPDFIKVDVEGFEKLVFEGFTEYLKKEKRPVIIFEFVDWAENQSGMFKAGDAQQYLLERGYKLYDFDKFSDRQKQHFNKVWTEGSGELIAIPE